MAHFQERRSGSDRRQFKGGDRRSKSERRDTSCSDTEFIEQARFKAWMTMTSKEVKD